MPRFPLHNELVPHRGNDYLPYALRRGALLGMTGLILLSFLASNVYALLWQYSDWLVGAVLPAVVVTLTNEERDDEALVPLVRNPILDEAATLKAEDMAKNGYFAHYSPAGVSPWHWFNQVGYSFVHAGENLAVHFTDSGEVVDAWMQSPTHRANIVNGNYREIGVGVARGRYDGYDTVFVVQLFGTPAAPMPPTTATVSLPPITVRAEAPEEELLAAALADEVVAVAADETVAGAELALAPEVLDTSTVPPVMTTEPILPTLIKTEVTPESVSLYSGHAATSTNAPLLDPALAYTDTETEPVSWVAERAVQPHQLLQIIYVILGSLVALALIIAVVIEWRHQRPRHVLYGIGLLLLMSGLFYIHGLVTAGARVF